MHVPSRSRVKCTIRAYHAPKKETIGEEKEDNDNNYYRYGNYYGESVRLMNCLNEADLISTSTTQIRKYSLPLTCSVKRVTKLVAIPQITPINVPPTLTTKKDVHARATLINKKNYEKSEI